MRFNYLGSVALIALLATAEPAQALLPVSIGVRAGLPFSGLSGQSLSGANFSSSLQLGYLLGVGVDAGLGPVGVMADVLLAKRSYQSTSFLANTSLVKFSQSRIEIPVQAYYSIGPVHISGGAYYAMGVGKLHVDIAGIESDSTYDAYSFKSSETGLVAGLGVSLPLGLVSLSLDARYLFGLNDLSSNVTANFKQRSFDVVAGVWF